MNHQPPARRAKGEGTHSIDPRTGRHLFRVTVDGRRVTGRGDTLRGAKADAKAKSSHVEAGRPDGKPESFEAMLRAWLADSIEPNYPRDTFRGYATAVNRWLVPELGNVAAHDVRPSQLERVYRTAQAAGRGPALIGNIKTTASAAFRWAIADGRVAGHGPASLWNPARMSTLPRDLPPKASRPAPTMEAVEGLLMVTDRIHNGGIWRAMAEGALRPSEAAGLRWADVDLEAGLFYVRGALRHDKASGEYLWTAGTKNTVSRKPVAIGPELAASLHRQKTRGNELRLASRWESDAWAGDLVFRNERDGRGLKRPMLCHWLKRLCEVHRLESVTSYQLRHYLPTRLAARGIPARIVADLLGNDVRTAERYYIDPPTEAVDYAEIRAALGF